MKQYIADYENIIDDSENENMISYFDDFSSILSVIDDAKLIEFELNELFLTLFDSINNIEFVFIINLFANKVFKLRLIVRNDITISEIVSYIYISIIESRYNDHEFKSILMNCEVAKRLNAEIKQFAVLQRLNDAIKLNKAIVKSKIQFDIDSISIMSTIKLNISLELMTFHIIKINILFLLCLIDLDRLDVYFNNLTNELMQKRIIIFQIDMKNFSFSIILQTDMKNINRFSIILRYEHAFLLWKILNQFLIVYSLMKA